MKLRNVLLMLVLSFVALPVMADGTVTVKDPAAATATETLNARLAQMDEAQKQVVLDNLDKKSTVDNAREWVDLGKGLGSGLASTAKELGVAANDFVKSPVGEVSMFLLVWHYMGDQLLGLFKGIMLLAVFLPYATYLARKTFGKFVTVKNAKGDERVAFAGYDYQKFDTPWGLLFVSCVIIIFIVFVCVV
jgi:hypothetical protein